MNALSVRNGWAGWLMASLAALLFLTACSTTTVVVASAPPPAPEIDDQDFSELIAQLRSDLNRYNGRHAERTPGTTGTAENRRERERAFAARARALFAPLNGSALYMPVVGVQPVELYNSWGASRDGGRRRHKGIDIFAPKGTAIVAVADGVVSYIGEQPKGGLCLWLTTENGTSFYYAHLDRWAAGLYEGMEVRSGDLLGYVGNTGNAKSTPPHLHFGINDNDEMVNPYPVLTKAAVVKRARVTVEAGGAAMGTR